MEAIQGELWEEVREFYGQALAPTTTQQCSSYVKWFVTSCVVSGYDHLDPTEDEVMVYERCKRGK